MLVLTLLFLLLCVDSRCWSMEDQPILVSSGSVTEQSCPDSSQSVNEPVNPQLEIFQKVIQRATLALQREKEKNLQEIEQLNTEHAKKIEELMLRLAQYNHKLAEQKRIYEELLDVEAEKTKHIVSNYGRTIAERDKEIERQRIELNTTQITCYSLKKQIGLMRESERWEKEFTQVSSSPPRVTISSSSNQELDRLKRENALLRCKVDKLEKTNDDNDGKKIRKNSAVAYAKESCINFSKMIEYMQNSGSIRELIWAYNELKVYKRTSTERSQIKEEQINNAIIQFIKKHHYPLQEAVLCNFPVEVFDLMLDRLEDDKHQQIDYAIKPTLDYLGLRDEALIKLFGLCTRAQINHMEAIKHILLELIIRRNTNLLEDIFDSDLVKKNINSPALRYGLSFAFLKILQGDHELEWLLLNSKLTIEVKNSLSIENVPLIIKAFDIGPRAVIKLLNNRFNPVSDHQSRSFEDCIHEKRINFPTQAHSWQEVLQAMNHKSGVISKDT